MAESSNKNLIRIIKRNIEDNHKSWHIRLNTTLWDNIITPKRAIGNSPFMLVYKREARLPLSLEFPSLELAHRLELTKKDTLTVRLAKLMDLKEVKSQAMLTLETHQSRSRRALTRRLLK